jgi:uncharacterized protein YlxW (UPF0749 family)
MTTAATMTEDVGVLAAEEALKDLLRGGKASAEALRDADEALQTARLLRSQAVDRARTRQAMQTALDEEMRARTKADREAVVTETLTALAAEAPTVTVEYSGLKVTIKLAGGMDHVARQTCLEAARRAMYVLDHRFSERLICTVNALTLGQAAPGESFTTEFINELTDRLRHAMKHGSVAIEL